jgi:hypothetical protein
MPLHQVGELVAFTHEKEIHTATVVRRSSNEEPGDWLLVKDDWPVKDEVTAWHRYEWELMWVRT